MKQKIVYIGLDVDDTQYHGAALNQETGALYQCYCTSGTVLAPVSSFVDQMCRNCAIYDTQHLTHCLGMSSEQVP